MPYTEDQIKVNDSIYEGNIDKLRELLAELPELATTVDGTVTPTPLHKAVSFGHIDMVRLLLEYKIDVNMHTNKGWSPLESGVSGGDIEIVSLLLSKGADAKLCRPLISAIRNEPPIDMELTRLLVEHGALINECYHPFDDKKQPQINPLSWAILHGKHEIAEYLRSKGAVIPPGQADPGPPTLEQEIVMHFEAKLGPVHPFGLQEVAATGLPVAIHVVPPSEGHNYITLFTTGMSANRMNVPADLENFRFAELMIQLPPDWPIPGFKGKTKKSGFFGFGKKTEKEPAGGSLWPFQWLQTIARYPAESGSFLGGPGVIFANGDPPESVAPGVPYTAFLLINVEEITCVDGKKIQLFQLLPLYTEERQLEIRDGLPALLTTLDRNNISWVVDLKRKNVGTDKR
ncbi:suppressor of fused domain protein [Anatilimnocola sp. NA78]|uniref:suppressor of fused domain protein n=1 Tax=Anatilimnocola sp. NA78 TaxID=3415683 RepID=UPI003CE4E67F